MIIGTPDEVVSKYVIQVSITYRKGSKFNKLGAFHVFKKGGWFGHADQLLKWCPHGNCTGLINDSFRLTNAQILEIGEDKIPYPEKWPMKYQALYENWYKSTAICPVCGKETGSMESLPDSYGFNMPYQNIAEKLSKLYYQLGSDCDLYLVRQKQEDGLTKAKLARSDNSISAGTRQIQAENKLQDIRNHRESVYYPLRKIISDTMGSDVATRFKALLEA